MSLLSPLGTVALAGCTAALCAAAGVYLTVKRFAPGQRFSFVSDLECSRTGNLFVVDRANSRVVVLSPSGTVVRQIGGAGQGDRDLLYPSAVSLGSEGTIAVLDFGNRRVQLYGPDGRPRGRIPYGTRGVYGLAVTQRGTVLLNEPGAGRLIYERSREGRLLGSFGRILPVAAIFPNRPADRYPTEFLNAADLASDSEGCTWAVFRFMPVVQRYSPAGQLIWQTRLDGPAVRNMEKIFWGDDGAPSPLRQAGIRHVRIPYFVFGSTLTGRNNLSIMLGNSVVLVIDRNGRQVRQAAYRLDAGSPPVLSMAEHGGRLFFGLPQSVQMTDGDLGF